MPISARRAWRGPGRCLTVETPVRERETAAITTGNHQTLTIDRLDLTGKADITMTVLGRLRFEHRHPGFLNEGKCAGIGPTDSADQAQHFVRGPAPVDQPVLWAPPRAIGGLGVVLLALWRFGETQGIERARQHGPQRLHVFFVEASDALVLVEVEQTLGENRAAVDAFVDPKKRAAGPLLVQEDSPGNHRAAAQMGKRGRVVADGAAPGDIEKARAADLRPADHEDVVRGEFPQPFQRRLVIYVLGLKHWHAVIGRLIVHVDEIRMPSCAFRRKRDEQIRPPTRRRHGGEGKAGAFNGADQNRMHNQQLG